MKRNPSYRAWTRSLLAAVCLAVVPCALAQFNFVTYSGAAGQPGDQDGPLLDARFQNPTGIAADVAGNLYVAATSGQTIRKIAVDGTVTTLAGSAGQIGSADGTGSAARFSYPWGIVVDPAGNLFVADSGNHTVRKITPAGVVTTIAGMAGVPGYADGTGSAARFDHPSSIARDSAGNLYVSDYANTVIRKITPAGVVTTFAGAAGQYGFADGIGGEARFNYPDGIAVDEFNNVFVADTNNHVVRLITPSGTVSTLAGTPGQAGSRDSIAGAPQFNSPVGLSIEPTGSVIITDRGNSVLRRMTRAGYVTTIGGMIEQQGTVDGPGITARFNFPTGVVVTAAGDLYLTDTYNQTVRRGVFAFTPNDYLVRPGTFDTNLMRQRYPFLADMFGSDDDSLWTYFVTAGIYGGLNDNEFVASTYLQSRAAKAQLFGTDWGAAAVDWYAYAHAPTASFTLSGGHALGDRMQISINVDDEDGNFSYANLWVNTPNRGWLAIRADSTAVVSSALSRDNAVATTAGTRTVEFAFTPTDGEGTYRFALAAVDTHRLRTDAPTQAVAITTNRAPTATLSVPSTSSVGQAISISLTVDDPDANYAYANLWVNTPGRGWLAIRADNSVVASAQISAANTVASTAGSYTRTFTFTPQDGAGTYTFALAAVDSQGLRTDATNRAVSVTSGQAPNASFTVSSATASMNGSVTINIDVSDADGDYAYANLWVNTPNRGWFAIRADNSVVQTSQLSSANNVAPAAGVYTRSFTFTPTDGAGVYTFALSAVDAQGQRRDAPNRSVTVTNGSAPTASLTLSSENQVGNTVTITVTVGDPDGDYSYANLWVNTPGRGWLAIRADNSVLASAQLTSANNVAGSAGTFTRTFTFTPADGAGVYTFALSAVDAQGQRTDAANRYVTVGSGSAPTAAFTLSSENQVGSTVTVTLTVDDVDGDYSYANLWVNTPGRGWLAIRADNSVVAGAQLTSANNVAAAVGTYTRTFTYTPTDGAGMYTFALSAVDASGQRTNAANRYVNVSP